jgi:hypothetical protein
MKKIIASLALAGTLLAGAPIAAQPNYGAGNSRDFWQGAPSGVWERIRYLQDRINRGARDGTLTRREAQRAQYQLDSIRRDAALMRRNGFSPSESASIQARLDNVSRNIRWARNNDNVRDPRYYDRYRTDYDASRYYREGSNRERVLTSNDEIYRGSDGRYYCKRSDGTTGLIVGAAAGGLLGNIATNGGNRLPGTLIGREIDRSDDVRCR